MSTYEAVLAGASHLPVTDRLQLIDAIWETLPADSLPPLSAEWIAEIQRRTADYDAGAVDTVTWNQVKADALSRVRDTVPDATR